MNIRIRQQQTQQKGQSSFKTKHLQEKLPMSHRKSAYEWNSCKTIHNEKVTVSIWKSYNESAIVDEQKTKGRKKNTDTSKEQLSQHADKTYRKEDILTKWSIRTRQTGTRSIFHTCWRESGHLQKSASEIYKREMQANFRLRVI